MKRQNQQLNQASGIRYQVSGIRWRPADRPDGFGVTQSGILFGMRLANFKPPMLSQVRANKAKRNKRLPFASRIVSIFGLLDFGAKTTKMGPLNVYRYFGLFCATTNKQHSSVLRQKESKASMTSGKTHQLSLAKQVVVVVVAAWLL